MKVGLVLEGGGMRGIYTSGVLDALMDRQARVDYVIGVSAGGNNGVSFVSGQRGRSRRVTVDYLDDKRYLSLRNMLRYRSLFGFDFIFGELAHEIDPFDYAAFMASPMEFVSGVTDAHTGKPVYFDKTYLDHDTTLLRASSSIPLFAPVVTFHGGEYLDGGTTDPVPFARALEDGCERLIVVLTQHREYVKKPEKMSRLYTRLLKKYPMIARALDERHTVYMRQREALWQLEKEGRAVIIAPEAPLGLSRFEKDKEKLDAAYGQGIHEADACFDKNRDALLAWGVVR